MLKTETNMRLSYIFYLRKIELGVQYRQEVDTLGKCIRLSVVKLVMLWEKGIGSLNDNFVYQRCVR